MAGWFSNVTTTDEIVQPGPTGPLAWPSAPEGARRRKWPIAVAVLAALVALGLVGSAFITLPYYAIAPGSAPTAANFVQIPQDKRLPPKSNVMLVTVLLRTVGPIEYLQDKFINHDVSLVPEKEILGTTPKGQLNQVNNQLMSSSETTAEVVALRRLGYAVPEIGKGAVVMQVEPKSAADGHLRQGDVVLSADGQQTLTADALVKAIHNHKPGQVIKLDVQAADGTARTETVTLNQRDGKTFLGVYPATKQQNFDLPVKVNIDAGPIGGPSAGLAFTLTILDELTPGDLAGGKKVAATGTIAGDGTVGPIGGIAQKTITVSRAGADVFLVPADEYNEAVAHAGKHLRVIKVAKLEDALNVLRSLGGDFSKVPTPAPATYTSP
jgi:Lon-like protease